VWQLARRPGPALGWVEYQDRKHIDHRDVLAILALGPTWPRVARREL
jgi:hypothetical protein